MRLLHLTILIAFSLPKPTFPCFNFDRDFKFINEDAGRGFEGDTGEGFGFGGEGAESEAGGAGGAAAEGAGAGAAEGAGGAGDGSAVAAAAGAADKPPILDPEEYLRWEQEQEWLEEARRNRRKRTRTERRRKGSGSDTRMSVEEEESKENSTTEGQSYKLNIFDQKRKKNKVDQCHCIKPRGSTSCIEYDDAYQAATFTEAILYFPDLIHQHAKFHNEIERQDWIRCDDMDHNCRSCARSLEAQLKKKLPDFAKRLRGDFLDIHFHYSKVYQNGRRSTNCKRYGFNRRRRTSRKRTSRPLPGVDKDKFEEVMTALRTAGQQFRRREKLKKIRQDMKRRRRLRLMRSRRRHARQIESKRKIIGTRHIIYCVNKGEPDREDLERQLSLCHMCWAWRELPDDFFPPIINELVCMKDDDECLAGWGSCIPRFRSLNLLQKMSQREWERVTITAGSCCDCHCDSSAPFISKLIT